MSDKLTEKIIGAIIEVRKEAKIKELHDGQ